MVKDLLSQDEIEALFQLNNSVDCDIETESGADPTGIVTCNVTGQGHSVLGHVPTLEVINERFAHYISINLFNLRKKTTRVSVAGTRIMKYGDYIHTLFEPAGLDIIYFKSPKGAGLVVLDANLALKVADNPADRVLPAATELGAIQMVLEQSFVDLSEAWKAVMTIDCQIISCKAASSFSSLVDPDEVAVVSTFVIDFEGGSGNFQTVIPYSMIASIRDDSAQSDLGSTDI